MLEIIETRQYYVENELLQLYNSFIFKTINESELRENEPEENKRQQMN